MRSPDAPAPGGMGSTIDDVVRFDPAGCAVGHDAIFDVGGHDPGSAHRGHTTRFDTAA